MTQGGGATGVSPVPQRGAAAGRGRPALHQRELCALCGSAVCSSPATAARGFDADSFSRTQANTDLAGDFLRRTVTPDDQRAAGSAVDSAGQAVRAAGTAVGEQSDLGIG